MKKILLTISLVLSICFVFGQSARYAEAMQKQIALLDSARTAEAYQQLANTFERIGNAEKTEWHPFYYAGYALIMQAYMQQDPARMDPLLDKADEAIAKAASLQPDHSEITNLMAMVLQARMRVDMSRGMTLAPKATALLQKAVQQQPANNPRVTMNLAQNIYYTPEAFGGSKSKGIALLEQALQQFEAFAPATAFDPVWGKPYAGRTLAQWKSGK